MLPPSGSRPLFPAGRGWDEALHPRGFHGKWIDHWKMLEDVNDAATSFKVGPDEHSARELRLAVARAEGVRVVLTPHDRGSYDSHLAAARVGSLPPAPVFKGLRGWDDALHPRGWHGRWTGAGTTGGRPVAVPDMHQALREQGAAHKILSKLNDKGHKIMKGYAETHHIHSNGRGGYKTARIKAVHLPYWNHEMDSHREQAKPKALFTSGGAASGKSWIKDNRSPADRVLIDPDEAKNKITEYNDLKKTGNGEVAASAVHEESSSMAKVLTAVALSTKRNITVDSVGDSESGKFVKKIQAAQAHGHEVSVEHMHLNVKTAMEREHQRFLLTGRKVKEEDLRAGHASAAERMGEVAMLPGVKIVIWSSTTKPPHIIAEGVGGPQGLQGLSVVQPEEWAEFLKKGGHDGK